jgi:hypothetical protein
MVLGSSGLATGVDVGGCITLVDRGLVVGLAVVVDVVLAEETGSTQ